MAVCEVKKYANTGAWFGQFRVGHGRRVRVCVDVAEVVAGVRQAEAETGSVVEGNLGYTWNFKLK